jgi:phosphatidate cytidylyltransferase
MDSGDPTNDQEKSFGRPWEQDDADSEAEVFTLPGIDEDRDDDFAKGEGVAKGGGAKDGGAKDEDVELTDWDAIADTPTDLDDFTAVEYSAATTEEYRGLAEDVSRAAEEDWELQPVAATVPGVDSGLVGFEDVTGEAPLSEDHHEATEQAATSDITMRIGSALIIFGMFLGSLLLGGWWFAGFIALVMMVGVGEFYATVRSQGISPLALFGLVGVALMALGAQVSGPGAIAGWAAAVTTAVILFYSLSSRANPLDDAAVTVGGMVWVGLLSFAILFAKGPSPVASIMFLVLLVVFNDMGGYFVGRAFGRRKLAPVLSPAKTVEGFFGGLVATVAVAAVLATFPAWEAIGFGQAIAAALLVSVFAPIGDLIESMVKRSLGVKDMGSVLPGHGGILDRIDGFIVTVPAVYLLFRGFGLL